MPSIRLDDCRNPLQCVSTPDSSGDLAGRRTSSSSQEKTDYQIIKGAQRVMKEMIANQRSPNSVVLDDSPEESEIMQIYEDLNVSDVSWRRHIAQNETTTMTQPEKMKLNFNITPNSSKKTNDSSSTLRSPSSHRSGFNESLNDFSLVNFSADQGLEITDQEFYNVTNNSTPGSKRSPNNKSFGSFPSSQRSSETKPKSQLWKGRINEYANDELEEAGHDQSTTHDHDICTVMEESDKLVRQRHAQQNKKLQNLRTTNNKSLLETDPENFRKNKTKDYQKTYSYREFQTNFSRTKTNNPNGISTRSDGFFSTTTMVPDADTSTVPSILGYEGNLLFRDPAFRHAQQAGMLWQSLVGQHVRFPSSWWNGARAPPMGVDDVEIAKWTYYGRHSVRKHPVLNQLIRGRASAGRLLLHVIVQDIISRQVILDIAVGSFHPNAKGIRLTERALRSLEESREVWIATRSRTRNRSCISPIDQLIAHHSNFGPTGCTKSPIATDVRVTNTNVRAVFGDTPPLETVYVIENELQERLHSRGVSAVSSGQEPMAMKLLQEFVFAE
jgi:hypothetical protein